MKFDTLIKIKDFFGLQAPEFNKLVISGAIVVVALICLVALKRFFPVFDWVSTESTVLALVAAWVVNLVKEATGN